MVDLLMGALAVVLWLIVGVKSREPVRLSPGGPWLRRTFLLLVVASTIFLAPVGQLVAAFANVPDLAEPLGRTMLLGAAFCAQELLRRLVGSTERGRRRRMRLSVFAVGIGLLWTAFILGSIEGSAVFGSYAAPSLWPATFLIVFLTIFSLAVAEVMLGCQRYAGTARGPLSVGLRLIAWGCAFGLGYAAVKFLAEAMALASRPMAFGVEAVAGQLLAVMAGALVALGATWPALCRHGRGALDWLRSYAAHRRLYPLWKALAGPSPQLALDPPSNLVADLLRVRHLRTRLYRRVIEIRDGQLMLRHRLDPAVFSSAVDAARCLGLDPAAAAAFVEAKLTARVVAQMPVESPMLTWPRGEGEGGSMDSEVVWLLAVAEHFGPGPRAWHALRVSIPHPFGRMA